MTPLRPLRQHMRTLQPAHGEIHAAEWAVRVAPSVPYMRSQAGCIKNADVQDPDSIPWRDDPWPREPPKPCARCGTWTAPKFTIGHRARVFPGGPGRTTSPEDFASLMNDLESKIFGRFDDDTVVHPGHGEGPHLAEWWKRGW